MTTTLDRQHAVLLGVLWHMARPMLANLSSMTADAVTDLNIRGAGGLSINRPSVWANSPLNDDRQVREIMASLVGFVKRDNQEVIDQIWEKALSEIPNLEAIRFTIRSGRLYKDGVICRLVGVEETVSLMFD